MISSMTGFAREAGSTAGVTWAWELKSVNGRGLDIRVRVPTGFDALGEEARKAVTAAAARGTVNVALNLQRAEQGRVAPRLNMEALTAVHRDVGEAARALGLPLPGIEALLQLKGVFDIPEQEAGPSPDLAAALAAAAAAAARGLQASRRMEGQALEVTLRQQIDRIEALVSQVASHPARGVEAIMSRLGEQVRALMQGGQGLDQARLHQEAALLAVRADVREEIDRLAAHVDAARTLLGEGGAIGRKLDFLAQEFGREASTLCAKANHVELSRIGLELRTVVDQFREQAQNVE